jgi:hypothetical protein
VTASPLLPSSLLNDVRAILQEARGKAYAFPNVEKGYAVRSELSWTHWRLIMRVEDAQARDYYRGETR